MPVCRKALPLELLFWEGGFRRQSREPGNLLCAVVLFLAGVRQELRVYRRGDMLESRAGIHMLFLLKRFTFTRAGSLTIAGDRHATCF